MKGSPDEEEENTQEEEEEDRYFISNCVKYIHID